MRVKVKVVCSHKNLHPDAHSSITQNNQGLETLKCSLADEQINTMHTHTTEGYSSFLKEFSQVMTWVPLRTSC